MKNRAKELIKLLKLKPHPEGGHYVEVFRSTNVVRAKAGRRAAITTIYFLLRRGEFSCFHRVTSDEVWHFVEGAPLRLHQLGVKVGWHKQCPLGPVKGNKQSPIAVVAAGDWQAAETTGEYTLVACDVGPGFDFADFAMLRDDGRKAALVRERFPKLVKFV